MFKKGVGFVCFLAILFMSLSISSLFATGSAEAKVELPPVTIRIGGNYTDCRALEIVAANFMKKYPNCTVIYEYLQGDYHEVLKERMLSEGDNRVDLFFTTSNIQKGNKLDGYALDLMSKEDLDLSNTFPSLINNYMYIEEDGSAPTKLYSIPLGAQMRGLFVNVSLLKSVGIEKVPTNQAELLEACEILKKAGYIPFQGDASAFAQQLLYPWICNNITNASNYEEAYNLVNTRSIEATKLFRDVYEFLYTLVENDYYDYYTSQKVRLICKDASGPTYARSLLNIIPILDANGNETGEYKLGEGVGETAFLPNAISLNPTVKQMKEDYHSQNEIVFVPAPVGVDGGYVYLSPADAIGINKDSEKTDWAIKFLNFLFTPENNEEFADAFSVMPNTKESFSYIADLFSVPENHISELGQATFDWSFYRILTRAASDDTRALVAMSKANNPSKFNPETNEMYPFEFFWKQFEEEFTTLAQ